MMRLLFLSLLFVLGVYASPTFPTLTSHVVDGAKLFSSGEAKQLRDLLSAHEQQSSNQIVVVTLASLDGEEIADYGYQLGRHWGIGQKGKDNGVLVIIAPNERKVRIEVGYGLEGSLTDVLAHTIIDHEIVPQFKQKRYFEGTLSGVKAIIAVIKGEYEADENITVDEAWKGKIFLGLLLLFLFFYQFIPSHFQRDEKKGKVLHSSLGGLFFGMMFWVAIGVIAGIIAAVVVSLFLYFSRRRTDFSSFGGYDSRSSGGSFGSGGFSGGGGSFGGGGASGSW
jgi:uncharacterized protein